jgi:hypothetical protein
MEVTEKMAAKKKVDENAENDREKVEPAEDFPNELKEPLWAVITFEKCAAKDLTYTAAEEKLRELEAQNVSGLCIVTNEVAKKLPA